MEHECMIFSNNPEPDQLALYFERDGKEVFREEFHVNDRAKDFELKYTHVSEKIQAPDPRFVVPTLSEGFARLVSNMCVKDRDQRYQTWDDVFNDARAVEEGGLPTLHAPEAVSSIQVQ